MKLKLIKDILKNRMRARIIACFLILLFILGFMLYILYPREIIISYPNGCIREKYYLKRNISMDIVKTGKYESWHNNGQKRVQAFYRNGNRDGNYISWFYNGFKKNESSYSNGKLEGMYGEWYKDGRKKKEGYFRNGLKDSVWIEWLTYGNREKKHEEYWKQGKRHSKSYVWLDTLLLEERSYKNGVKDGYWRIGRYQPNEGTYKKGKKHGRWIEWGRTKQNFRIKHEGEYRHGRREGVWTEIKRLPTGEISSVSKILYKNDKLEKKQRDLKAELEIKEKQRIEKSQVRNEIEKSLGSDYKETESYKHFEADCPRNRYKIDNGPFTGCYPNSRKMEEGFFKNGKLEGRYVYWTSDGWKWEEHTYKGGKLHGQFIRYYYNNRMKKQHCVYKSGKLNGYVREWHWNGKKKLEAEYKNGVKNGRFFSWYNNGQKKDEKHFTNGKKNGRCLTWYENGFIRSEATYKNGELVKCKYEKGKPCNRVK